jgi:hypothetical protein
MKEITQMKRNKGDKQLLIELAQTFRGERKQNKTHKQLMRQSRSEAPFLPFGHRHRTQNFYSHEIIV